MGGVGKVSGRGTLLGTFRIDGGVLGGSPSALAEDGMEGKAAMSVGGEHVHSQGCLHDIRVREKRRPAAIAVCGHVCGHV